MFSIFPLSFWVVIALLLGGLAFCAGRMRDGIGLPMAAVLATVCVWYVGDAFYNDYAGQYMVDFDPATLSNAWCQVAVFLIVFLAAAPAVHRRLNGRDIPCGSGVLFIFRNGVGQPAFQKQMNVLYGGCVVVWVVLTVVAVIRLKELIVFYFFPFLGFVAEPWERDRIGHGLDAILSLAAYLQLLVASTFGVVAATAQKPAVRRMALVFCLLSWPYYIFGRTRNFMLAVVIPAVLCWIFFRLRGSMLKRLGVLALCFLTVNAWMKFVIANRSHTSVTEALHGNGLDLAETEKAKHEGLNMYEELCWINTFMKDGTYNPTLGARYFAEAVNFVPRALWHGKPEIGIDYAIARGQGGGEDDAAGVHATISTGLIGQGVVNFGTILGPAAAALLMSVWVAMLARMDLHLEELGRVSLYSMGLILTFNLGRDITLLTIYPFLFGLAMTWWMTRSQHKPGHALPPPAPSRSSAPDDSSDWRPAQARKFSGLRPIQRRPIFRR